MPELPEVEIVRRGLTRLIGHTVSAVTVGDKQLRKSSPVPLAQLAGLTLSGLRRHAKVLFFDFSSGHTMAAHLGMTGKFLFNDKRAHTHLTLTFDDETLSFSDPRRFGWLALYPPGTAPADAAHYGVDALAADHTPTHLATLLSGSRAPLKSFLLDQTKVAGIGNIYACEALFLAGLSPRRLACNTPKARIELLHEGIQEVLRASINAGGTSFNDYVDSLGQQGSFLFEVHVFRREGEACHKCSTPVRRIVQAGRSTFYCPTCQS